MSTVFEVTKLRKNFGGLAVTNDVSLSMAKGDRVALIGPNGAGKTTFVNLVTGNLAATSGTVALGGENVSGLNAMQRVRRGLVRSFQVTRLFFDMTLKNMSPLLSCSAKVRRVAFLATIAKCRKLWMKFAVFSMRSAFYILGSCE